MATDVCAALDYKNTSKAVGDHLDEDERAAALVPRTPNDSLGVPTNIINESGLYALVLRSRKPEARKFGKRMIEMPPGQMLVDRKKLAALWVDLGKIRSRIDAMGCIESDFPPSWWAEKAIN